MTDLTKLSHELDTVKGTCRAVIETSRGRRAKYDYDPAVGGFVAATLLPEGMSFPLDFGFIPSTRAEDGDPLDVLVLFDEPCEMGAVLGVRLVGIIEGEQTEGGRTIRNDRLLAVPLLSRLYSDVRRPEDLGDEYLRNLNAFWTQYNALRGRRFEVRNVRGADVAIAAVLRSGGG